MKRKLINIYIVLFAIFFVAATYTLSMADFMTVRAVENEEITSSEKEKEEAQEEFEQVMPKLPVTPEMPELSDEYKVVETYETNWPDFLNYDIRYDKYSVFPHYVVNISSARKLYAEPDSSSDRLDKIYYAEKKQALAMVEGAEGEKWYAVICDHDGEKAVGFVEEDKVYKREFQFEEMKAYLEEISGFTKQGHVVYIENYKNANGYPEKLPDGAYYDEFGYRRSQSAAGYYSSDLQGEFRYIPDGVLGIVEEVVEITETKEEVIVINNRGEFIASEQSITDDLTTSDAIDEYNKGSEVLAVKIYVPSFKTSLWVDQKYLNEDEDSPDVLNQAILVDRKYQNIVVFEYNEDISDWVAVSINYSTTGKVGQFSLPTPLGYYMAIIKRPKFNFVADGTSTIVGYAPYAIRFSGGGYLHGVPASYSFDEKGNRLPASGNIEYLSSIGTIPKSHMCVRNYTSHAKFMYDWVDIGNCAIIVME